MKLELEWGKDNYLDDIARTLHSGIVNETDTIQYIECLQRWLLASTVGLTAYFILDTGQVVTLPAPADLSKVPKVISIAAVDHTKLALHGAESFAVDAKGDILTGTLNGSLIALDPVTFSLSWEIPCSSKCRILGLRAYKGSVYGVDLYRGVFKVAGRELEWLLDDASLAGIGFINDLLILEDNLYFTDSMPDFKQLGLNLLKSVYSFKPQGRVYKLGLISRELSVELEGLYVPNGLELHWDNKTILINEGTGFKILGYDPSSKAVTIFTDALLGGPDNIRRSSYPDQGYWVGISAPRTSIYSVPDLLAGYPTVRWLLIRLPYLPFLIRKAIKLTTPGSLIMRVDKEGAITQVIVDPGQSTFGFSCLSEMLEVGDSIIVGSAFSKLALALDKSVLD